MLSQWSLSILAYLLVLTTGPAACIQASVQELAAQYSLTTSTSLPFPSATQVNNATESFLVSEWSLNNARIQDGAQNVAFVADPFPNAPAAGISPGNPPGPVLQVTYPEKTFSHDSGGTQFYSLWNASEGHFNSMMLSYEVAFDAGFDFVKGGKLPGLRGGLARNGCSGGAAATGFDCFSARLMWRTNGAGEGNALKITRWGKLLTRYHTVYAYIPTENNLCAESTITCNSDFGTSVSRGSWSFNKARWVQSKCGNKHHIIFLHSWNRVTLLVQLNDPPNVANGNLEL